MKPSTTLLAAVCFIGSALVGYGSDGAELWTKHCAKCHGADGKGDTNMGKKLKIRDYTDPAVQAEFTDEQMIKAINEGVKTDGGKTRMKPIEGLSEADVSALIQHMRSLKK